MMVGKAENRKREREGNEVKESKKE